MQGTMVPGPDMCAPPLMSVAPPPRRYERGCQSCDAHGHLRGSQSLPHLRGKARARVPGPPTAARRAVCWGQHVGRKDRPLTTTHGSKSRDGDVEAGQNVLGREALGPGSGVQVGSPPWVLVGRAMALEVQGGGGAVALRGPGPHPHQDLIPRTSSSPVLLGPQPSCTLQHAQGKWCPKYP